MKPLLSMTTPKLLFSKIPVGNHRMKYFLCYLPQMDPEYHQQSNYFDVSANRFAQNLLSELSPAHELELGALADYLSLPPGSTLIDFGCGSGRVSLYFLWVGSYFFKSFSDFWEKSPPITWYSFSKK